jgi:hypothetical protein
MFQEFYRTSEWLTLPLVTLVFFFLFFVGVLIRVVFGMRDRRQVERLARLPFASEREHEESRHE